MQKRAYAARVARALDGLPLAGDEEGLRVERLLEDGGCGFTSRDERVAVREAADRDARGRVVGPARRDRGVRRRVPVGEREELYAFGRDGREAGVLFERYLVIEARRQRPARRDGRGEL